MTTTRLQWALFALIVTTLPFANDVPGWILPVIGLTIAWRYLAHLRRWRLPHVVLRMGWAFTNFALVFYSYGTINGLEPGSALLLLMSAMKLTESARARDLIVVVYMAFFNVVTHALYDQQIAATVYGAAALVVVVAALIQVTRRTEPAEPRRVLSRSGSLLAQALPLMLLLFLLFPRVPGPFWALPTSSRSVTGLSDSMNVGSISELLESGATAFRAHFEGPPPPPAQRYWRGPVFDQVVGNQWTAGPPETPKPMDIELGDPVYNYDLTLEPHQRRWVFALDLPAPPKGLPANTTMNQQLQILTERPIKERTRLRLRGYPNYRVDVSGSGLDRERYLDVTSTRNPRTASLARSLRAEHGTDDMAIVQSVLTRFGEAPFSYTLRPPPINTESASDAFLFDTRAGFCEYYASSFALIMRYAGIPARVVTGYQGGELNPIGRHLTVRQSDAHAWTEIWLPSAGWVRIDPTAAVSPDRVERGISSALGGSDALSPILLGNGPILTRVRLGWDAVNAAWDRHVLGYGQKAQRGLLRRLGFDGQWTATLVALLTASGTAVLAALALILAWRQTRHPRDPLLVGWRRVTARLAAVGLERAPHEPPLRYAQRVADARPDLARDIATLARQFITLRYGRGSSGDARRTWLRAVARFRPTATPQR